MHVTHPIGWRKSESTLCNFVQFASRKVMPFHWKLNKVLKQQVKSEGFNSCNRPNNVTPIGFKQSIFPYDIEICWMISQNYRAPLICYVKFCASLQSHLRIQTRVTVRKHPIRFKIGDYCSMWPSNLMDDLETKWHLLSATCMLGQNMLFFALCDLEIWRMTLKIIDHLVYGTSSFVHHLIAIGEFKLELQSRNAQFWSKPAMLCSMSAWNLTDDLKRQQGTSCMLLRALRIIPQPFVDSNWIYNPETPRLVQNLLWPLLHCALTSDLDPLHGHYFCQW